MQTEKTDIQEPARNRAYVLIRTEANKAVEVAKALRSSRGIAWADVVNGPYGVIAVVEDSDISVMAKTIVIDIRKIGNVRDTIVYMTTSLEESGTQNTRPETTNR